MLGANPVPIQVPIGAEIDFKGVVDLLERKAYVWDDSGLPENYNVEEIPADMTLGWASLSIAIGFAALLIGAELLVSGALD